MNRFNVLRKGHIKSAVLLALLFSMIQYASASLTYTENRAFLLFKTCLFFVVSSVVLFLLFWVSDRLGERTPERTSGKGSIVQRYSGFFFSFFTILFFWSAYYLMCFPGNIEWDTGTSLLFSLGIDRSNTNNPYFQTILFGGAYRFGKLLGNPIIGIGVYCFLQYITYIIVLSYALYRIGRYSRRAQLLLTILYSLVPAFPIYALTMGKDSNFAVVILAYVCISMQMVRNPAQFFRQKKKVVLLAAVVVLIGLLRNMAIFVPVISVDLFAAFVYKERKAKKYAAVLSTAALFLCFVFPKILGIPGGNIREALSVPIQQTGYYMSEYRDEVTPEEYKKITGIMPDKYIKKYNPSIADPVKVAFKKQPTRKQLTDYFSAWFSQFLKHPAAYGRAWYLLSYGYYTPYADLSDIKRHTFIGFKLKTEIYDKIELTPNTNEYLRLARKLDLISLRVPVYNVFTKIGLYTWFMSAGIIILLQKRQYAWFICFAPVIMVIVGCCFSPVNGYYRYALPMILCTPVLFVSALFLEKGENCPKKLSKQ